MFIKICLLRFLSSVVHSSLISAGCHVTALAEVIAPFGAKPDTDIEESSNAAHRKATGPNLSCGYFKYLINTLFSFFFFLSCNSIKGKNKAVNCSVPSGCRHLRPWYPGRECAVHFQNGDPDMNIKLCNDTANTLSYKQRWRLTVAPSVGLNCDRLQGRFPGTRKYSHDLF